MDYHHGNLREVLIQIGDDELKRAGLHDLSLRDLAERAGVSHNAPYRHFQTKAHLVEEIALKSLREWSEQILAAPLLYNGSIVLQLQFASRIFIQTASRYPHKSHLLWAGNLLGGPLTHLSTGHNLVLQSICHLIDSARNIELRNNIQVHLLALHFLSTMRGLCLTFTSRQHRDILPDEANLIEIGDHYVQLILEPHFKPNN